MTGGGGDAGFHPRAIHAGFEVMGQGFPPTNLPLKCVQPAGTLSPHPLWELAVHVVYRVGDLTEENSYIGVWIFHRKYVANQI
jgi:hypothetical protein